MGTHPRRRRSPASVIMIAAMFGVICAMVSSALAPTVYRATATAFVSTSGTGLPADRGPAAPFAQQVAGSFSSLATSLPVLDAVIERLALDTTSSRLAERIEVEQPADTSLLRVTVTDRRPAEAASIANAVVRRLAAISTDLQPQTFGAAATTVTQVQRAVLPQSPSGLALPVVVLLGLGTGGGIAAIALLVTWLVRRRPPPGAGLLAPSML